MHRPDTPRSHSPFFQVIAFFIMFTLFLSTTVNANADDPSGIGTLVQQICTLLFDSAPDQESSTSTTGDLEQTTSRDSTYGTDPTEPPPPPK